MHRRQNPDLEILEAAVAQLGLLRGRRRGSESRHVRFKLQAIRCASCCPGRNGIVIQRMFGPFLAEASPVARAHRPMRCVGLRIGATAAVGQIGVSAEILELPERRVLKDDRLFAAQENMPLTPGPRFPFIRQRRMMAMTFVETSAFSRLRERYLDDEHFRLLQASLMRAPDAGAVMKGSGGLRKLRWGVQGSGKRGGLRVIYYWPRESSRIYLMAIYRKTEVADLSKAELRQLKSLLSEIETGLPGG